MVHCAIVCGDSGRRTRCPWVSDHIFRASGNSFASGVIEVDAGQTVVATDPYALARHPMYSGALVMLLGVPLALGSRWGLLLVIPLTLVIV